MSAPPPTEGQHAPPPGPPPAAAAGPAQGANPAAAGAAGDQDYLDKGLASVESKFGGKYGADLSKNRALNEKITDGIRGVFEKITGKKVPAKFSN